MSEFAEVPSPAAFEIPSIRQIVAGPISDAIDSG